MFWLFGLEAHGILVPGPGIKPLSPALGDGFSFFFFNYLFIYFRLCWVFVAVHGLSLVEARGGYSLVAGFRPLLLQSIGSSVPGLQ